MGIWNRKEILAEAQGFLRWSPPTEMFVEAAVGRKIIQVGSENYSQKEWNINTQLISTFALYLK